MLAVKSDSKKEEYVQSISCSGEAVRDKNQELLKSPQNKQTKVKLTLRTDYHVIAQNDALSGFS